MCDRNTLWKLLRLYLTVWQHDCVIEWWLWDSITVWQYDCMTVWQYWQYDCVRVWLCDCDALHHAQWEDAGPGWAGGQGWWRDGRCPGEARPRPRIWAADQWSHSWIFISRKHIPGPSSHHPVTRVQGWMSRDDVTRSGHPGSGHLLSVGSVRAECDCEGEWCQ